MCGAVPSQLSIHCLQNIELITLGPRGSGPNRIAEDPESWPDTLFLRDDVGAEANLGLRERDLPGTRSEDILALDPARSPPT